MFGWAMILGMIALSLMFLAGYGGMVSLVQMTVAGCAGYMVAIFGTSAIAEISLGWPWWLGVPVAIVIAVIFGTLVRRARGAHRGHLHHHDHARDRVGVLLLHAAELHDLQRLLRLQRGARRRRLFGIDWRAPVPFYYLILFWAVLAYLVVVYVSRSPFGLALQGIRDNARRMAALGFNVTAHRIAAYAFAALIAAIAGVLLVWHGGQISPGTAGVGPVIDILIIAVVGGLSRPIGAVHRRDHLRHPAHLRARRAGRGRPRRQALPAADRARLPADRAVLARRRARPVGALARPHAQRRIARRQRATGGHDGGSPSPNA